MYAMISLLAHSGIRSTNDYLEERADGTLIVSAAPSARWVDRVIATAPIYLVEIAKDWCKLLHAPDDAVKALAAIQGEVSDASTEPLDPTAQHSVPNG